MAHNIEILLGLLLIICTLAVIAQRLRFPFPILLVIAGLLIAFIPGLPHKSLDPDIVFLIFLPPILYSSAWLFSWEEFRMNLRPILFLAVGLVFFTIVCVGFAGAWLIPGLSLGTAFVLGAIVSPPDAVAAEAVLRRMHMPRKLMSILQGESLINDASGLVAYQFAVAAVVTGVFSFSEAGGDFIWVAVGGVATGLAFGVVVSFLYRFLEDPTVEIVVAFITAYASYLAAEQFGFSGVLSTVTVGLYLGHRASDLFSSGTLMQGRAFWGVINYVLDGLIFILIGLQFPAIMENLKGYAWWQLGTYVLLVYATITLARYAWLYGLTFLMRWANRRFSRHTPVLDSKSTFVVGWAGMRGVVSLAAALAIPETIYGGMPFPHRDLILFLTFSIIFLTLVFNGLTLPLIVRMLGIRRQDNEYQRELEARIKLFEGTISDLDEMEKNEAHGLSPDAARILRNHFETRRNWLTQLRESVAQPTVKTYKRMRNAVYHDLMHRARQRLVKMGREGGISEDLRKKLEYDIDVEEHRFSRMFSEE